MACVCVCVFWIGQSDLSCGRIHKHVAKATAFWLQDTTQGQQSQRVLGWSQAPPFEKNGMTLEHLYDWILLATGRTIAHPKPSTVQITHRKRKPSLVVCQATSNANARNPRACANSSIKEPNNHAVTKVHFRLRKLAVLPWRSPLLL